MGEVWVIYKVNRKRARKRSKEVIRETVLERGQQDPLESRGPRRRQEKRDTRNGSLILSRPRENGSKIFRISQRREGADKSWRPERKDEQRAFASLSHFFFSLTPTLSPSLFPHPLLKVKKKSYPAISGDERRKHDITQAHTHTRVPGSILG